ncbi:hypothetical protein KIMH_13890 [Bombiscardovia apis]|uniref:Uncharacterized protein n=1 Tax=Bombiscardovia apis TaxID=2932182 RepID=A0ABN6SIY0_9BIFI|nr:InlB B-repeat-containing protein [Bombiscardovia apis]BDR55278.1 hypothetical protein KIMH_13890 [Bombiscardovia apis]
MAGQKNAKQTITTRDRPCNRDRDTIAQCFPDPQLASCIARSQNTTVNGYLTSTNPGPDLYCSGVSSLKGLEAFSRISRIDLSNGTITSLEPLRHVSITFITFDNNLVSDISPLVSILDDSTKMGLNKISGVNNCIYDMSPFYDHRPYDGTRPWEMNFRNQKVVLPDIVLPTGRYTLPRAKYATWKTAQGPGTPHKKYSSSFSSPRPSSPNTTTDDVLVWNNARAGTYSYTFENHYVISHDYDIHSTPHWCHFTGTVSQTLYTTYEVKLDPNGGNPGTQTMNVRSNTAIGSIPVLPTRDHYEVTGWSLDKYGRSPWNLATNIVTQPITLYAQWKVRTYTVTFDPNGGSPTSTQPVVYNNTISSVTQPPNRNGNWRLTGWAKDRTGNQPWNLASNRVTDDLTLYAQWIKQYHVKFDVNGGSALAPDIAESNVDTGSALVAPTTVKQGWLVVGWSQQADGTGPMWNFSTNRVRADITLYAIWEKMVPMSLPKAGVLPIQRLTAGGLLALSSLAALIYSGHTIIRRHRHNNHLPQQ